MTADQFRKLALRLPDTVESAHHGHPDFRVGGRIFATLDYPASGWGMIKLAPEDQRFLVHSQPAIFSPAKGAWGRAGSTIVELRLARTPVVREALALAREQIAAERPRRRPRSASTRDR